MILITILNFILVTLALIGFTLTVFGTPVGIVIFMIYLFKRRKLKNNKLLKWSLILLSGVPILIVTFACYAVINLVATFFGINMLTSADGGVMPIKIY